MYIPQAHEENRIEVLHDLIESQPFASLVTMGKSGLFASHLPMVLDRGSTQHGLLKGHLSRANKQWRDFLPSVDALAIFSGPQHYITPSWYPEKHETGKVVPTWNYVVVHVYGHLKVVEDAGWLMDHLNSLTQVHETAMPQPWRVSDAPADYIASLVKGIVGLELPIERLEGKWKVSRNQPERNRIGVIEGLERLSTPESLAMKALMAAEYK